MPSSSFIYSLWSNSHWKFSFVNNFMSVVLKEMRTCYVLVCCFFSGSLINRTDLDTSYWQHRHLSLIDCCCTVAPQFAAIISYESSQVVLAKLSRPQSAAHCSYVWYSMCDWAFKAGVPDDRFEMFSAGYELETSFSSSKQAFMVSSNNSCSLPGLTRVL